MPRKTLADLTANPSTFTADERARLAALSDDAIDHAAEADVDHPPMSDDQLDRAVVARDVRLTREATGLTQGRFAARYHITLARLKDWEQGRFKPDSVAAAYLKVIRHHPKVVERVLQATQGGSVKSGAKPRAP